MLGAEEPLREAEAVLGCVLRQRGEEARRVEGDLLLLRKVGAAVEDVGFTILAIAHDHHPRDHVVAIAVQLELGVVDGEECRDFLPVFDEDDLVVMRAQLLVLGGGTLFVRGEQGLDFLGQHTFVLGRLGEPGLVGLLLVYAVILV